MILNFKTEKQLLDNWCWAAVTSSVSHYFNHESRWAQTSLAAKLINASCSIITPGNSSICDIAEDVANSLKLTGNYGGELMRPLTFSEVIQQINSGFPICCQIIWPGIDASHFVVIYGYQSTDVIIGDTQAGIFSLDYNQFSKDYRDGGIWERTVGVKK